ncbi:MULTISPECIES: DUF3857 domain-containing protein [unclassified Saccharicrinis]|uniref:DUF3857 domain-containing protein n=1 Tax=unclassified Saccharicrinis TaxID=2646859 RepID=UPI003D3569ED
MRNSILLILLTFAFGLSAQNATNEVWSAKPYYSEVEEQNEGENIIGILLKEKYEYFYSEEEGLLMNHTIHKKFRLNNDDAINRFNKISVALGNVIEVTDIKARTIKPNGKSIEFDKNNIKEIKDDESGKSYKIFAIDGIEIGDEVEYYVVRKMHASNFGRNYFQFNFPLQHASFEIICPNNLVYDIRGYNGFPNGIFEKLGDERSRFWCESGMIPAIKGEKFSYVDPRKQRIEYRLDYNYSHDNAQKLTWDDAAQRVYESMYLTVNPKTIEKWMELIQVQGNTEEEKVTYVEAFLKSNIYVEQFNADEFSDLDFVLEHKVTGSRGIVKLYGNILKQLGIEHQMVLTSERDNVRFDGSFQSWNYLDQYLIYFPNLDKYIDPSNAGYRLGVVNGKLTATDGLFIEPVRIGDFESAIGKIRYIPPAPYNHNYDNMIINMTLDVDSDNVRIVTERGLKGLSGGFFIHFFKMMDEEQQQNTLKEMTATKAPNPTVNKLFLRDSSDLEHLKDGEFLVHSDFTTAAFLEQAGPKLLLSIGEAIGQQVEMYFEDDRQSMAENDFNRMYYREISLQVPQGYKIVNPEAGELNVIASKGGEKIFGFESNYTYNGDIYKIVVEEYYKEIFVDQESFEGFKNVVNAAADFNKIVLVLEEK